MPATEVAAPYRLALVRPRSFCERTADLPVEPPAQFDLVISQATAQALGFTVPQELLAHATEVL